MKKTTAKFLAGILSAASVFSLASCSDDSSSGIVETTTSKTEWTGDNIEVTIDEEAVDTTVDISGQTLKWMGIYDLNPTNDSNERSVELAIFEDTYGAKIQDIHTTSATRFDDLATAIMGGDPPDIFIYEWRSFPYDTQKGQFQPVDSIIDWTDPMWADVKDTADLFTWKGEHYLAPLGYATSDTQVLMYNKTTVEEEGLDDPYELYLEGKWDWNAFLNIMKKYVDSGDSRYGICGWWENAFVYTSGDTLISYDGQKYVNNLYSEKIERAQNVLREVAVNELFKTGWFQGAGVFTDLETPLFYGMGTWAYNDVAKAHPDDVIQIVPFPRDPEQDKDFFSANIMAYMWVKGSENADCVKTWLNINRLVNYDPQYTDVTKEKFLQNNQYWSSEMYDVAMNFYDPDKFTFAFDYGFGLGTDMEANMNSLYYDVANGKYESWSQLREEYKNIVDEIISQYN